MAVNRLRGSKAPNLPVGPVEYAQRYQDQYSNVLRLYFNEIDNITGALLGEHPGDYLSLSHIAASDSTDQYATNSNVATIVKWNTLDSGYGWTLSPPGTATADYPAVYKITYSLQFINTDNAIHYATVWIKVNGSDLANSATKFAIPGRKSSSPGEEGYLCAYSEATFVINSGDDIQLYWATNQAYNPVGPVNGVYILHEAAQTSPFARPAIPSAIGSIVYVSRKPT